MFDYLPENRRLSPGTIEKTVSCLKLKPNNKYLQDKIIRETGKLPTTKDLRNLNAKFNRDNEDNDLKKARELLEEKGIYFLNNV